MMASAATSASILHSNEYDEQQIEKLKQIILDLAQHIPIGQLARKLRLSAYVLANFSYHTLSHFSGHGTLGNQVMEIVKLELAIVQVTGNQGELLHGFRAVAYHVLLALMGEPRSLTSDASEQHQALEVSASQEGQTTHSRSFPWSSSQGYRVAKRLAQLALLLNKGVFLFGGPYETVSSRICNTQYSFFGSKAQPDVNYRFIGGLLFIKSFSELFSINRREESYVEMDDAQAARSSDGDKVGFTPCLNGKCLLCLSTNCRHPTVTPCGHVFCWTCISEWCNDSYECPLCRHDITLPSLCTISHYS